MCKLVDIKEDYDVYIGRPSKWGNPYSHLIYSQAKYKTNTIEEAVKKYEEYLLNNKELFNSLYELKYKKIACWCKNKSKCHGVIIKKYVDKLEKEDERKNLLNI